MLRPRARRQPAERPGPRARRQRHREHRPPGQYAIGATTTTTAAAAFTAEDAKCKPTSDEQATHGTITLTQITTTTVAGTFDLTFANGDHLTGSFEAPVCTGTTLPGQTSTTCGS